MSLPLSVGQDSDACRYVIRRTTSSKSCHFPNFESVNVHFHGARLAHIQWYLVGGRFRYEVGFYEAKVCLTHPVHQLIMVPVEPVVCSRAVSYTRTIYENHENGSWTIKCFGYGYQFSYMETLCEPHVRLTREKTKLHGTMKHFF